MTDVSGVAAERLANEQRFYFFQAHLFDRTGAFALVAESKIAGADGLTLRQQHGALDGVVELANVARPEVFQHLLHRRRIEAAYLLAISLRIGLKKMLCQ